MRPNRYSLIVAAVVALFGSNLAAQGDVPIPSAPECCAPILLPIGARTVALGQALTAGAGAEAMFFNPGGLVDVTEDQFLVHRPALARAEVNTFSLLISSRLAGVFALTYRLIDFGDAEATQDGSGVPTGVLTTLDQVLIASYARRLAFGLSAGFSYKLYDFRNICSGVCGDGATFSGTTHLFDVGMQYQPSQWPHVLIGASLMHMGLDFWSAAEDGAADPTPARFRVGAAYEFGHHFEQQPATSIWLYTDLVQRVRDAGPPALNVGMEMILEDAVRFRLGRASTADDVGSGGLALGVGLKYQRFNISVGRAFSATPLDPEGKSVHITFAIQF
ncbi:MAG TPA: hypothetical protein VGD27_02300 [Longimicrobiales bacterium]